MPTLQELMSQQNQPRQDKRFLKTTYRWDEKDYPLMQFQTIQSLANNIQTHNDRVHYTSILFSGKSGSGKSTLTQSLIHRLACKTKENKTYVIKWFKGKDLHRLDTILEELGQGFNYILVWEDISYEMELADSGKKKKELASALTKIRHTVKGNVISIMQIHYLTALLPMMRDSDFRIITSMSDQDSKNWVNTLGKTALPHLRRFQKQYASQFSNGYFFVNNPDEKQGSKYITDEPFRIVLCSEMVGVHSMLVPKEGCRLCSPTKTATKKKIDPNVFWDQLNKAYRSRARPAFLYWVYFKYGIKEALPPNSHRVINLIEKIGADHNIPIEQVIEIANAKTKKTKTYVRKSKNDKAEKQILIDSGIIDN
jgi:DNA polymerase III delta prime subunit